MAQRGSNHFWTALTLFLRSLKFSQIKAYNRPSIEVGKDHLGNKYFETPAGKFVMLSYDDFIQFLL